MGWISTSVLFLLIFASGFASLLYQVLWVREFGVLLGNTVHAVSTVLAAFMAGLGIGGIVIGALADRQIVGGPAVSKEAAEGGVQMETAGGPDAKGKRIQPLKLYASLEGAIAISVVALEAAIRIVPPVYGIFYNLPIAPQLFYVLRFLFTFAILILPTFFMGGTIPAVAKFSIRGRDRGASAGWLYGMNTAGAAGGAFAAGFFFIERLGMRGTLGVALAINIAIAGIAFLLGRRLHVPEVERETAMPVNPGQPAGLFVYAFSGFVALGLEVVWSRTLVFSIGSTTYAFSAMVVIVLLGLALGSTVAAQILKWTRNPSRWIVAGQIAIALLSVSSLWVFRSVSEPMRDWMHFSDQLPWSRQLLIYFAQAALVLLPAATVFGAIFPLSTEVYLGSSPVGERIGRLLGFNTFAAIAGSLLTGFLFIPLAGIDRTYAILGAMSVFASLFVVRWRTAALIAAAWLLFVIAVPSQRTLEPLMPTEKLLFYKEGAGGTVSVIEDYSGNRNLSINHIAVAGTDPVFMTDQKSLAHLPMLLHPNPTKILTIGFGSGGASYSFTRYPQLERIDAVEIDPVVLEAAPYFKLKNGDPFVDPRFRVIRDDARSYLLYGREKYDIITTDCTDLRYRSNALLYAAEFFDAAKRRLNRDGMLVAWVPLGGLSTDDLKLTIRTFVAAFPNATAWYMYNNPTHYILLAGSTSDWRIDVQRLRERMNIPAVAEDLSKISLNDPAHFLASLFKDGDKLVTFTGSGNINSDVHPFLEFSVPKSANVFSLSTNLERFSRDTMAADAITSEVDLTGTLRSRDLIVQGHIAYNMGNDQYRTAIDYYRRAGAVARRDPIVHVLIQSVEETARQKNDEYEKLAFLSSADYKVFNELGLLRENSSDIDGSLEAFKEAVRLAPAQPVLHLNLGRIYDLKHMWKESAEAYQEAIRLMPDYADAWNNLGVVYLEQQNNADAGSAFERVTRLKPDSATAWFNLGLAALNSGRLDRSSEAFDHALELNAGYAEAYLNRGIVRLKGNDIEGAFADMTRALQYQPENAEAHYNLGIVEEQRRHAAEAALHYARAIELDPEYAMAYNNLGILYSEAGQPQKAIGIYSKAIRMDPNNPQLRNNLGMEYARIGDLDHAIEQYRKAIELEPRMFEPYANLGMIFRRRNQIPEAEKYLTEARRLKPDLKIP